MTCCRDRMAISGLERRTTARNCRTTKWWICRSTSCSRWAIENLRQNQEAFRVTAAKIDPKRTPQEILHDLEKDHPPPDHLLQTFRDVLGGLRQFIVEHKIVTIPSTVPPIVQETPPFARALSTASMDTPGPYEKVAKEAFFNVTLPEPGWTRRTRRGAPVRASTAAPSSVPPSTKFIRATTRSFSGCRTRPPKYAS